MQIHGKIAIVTGASGGIGLATANILTKKGAKVALVARLKDKLDRLARELPESFVVRADMSKEFEVRRMVEEVYKHYGKIDILVNNAGRGYDAVVEKINIETFRQIFDLDLIGPVVAMQEVIPKMRKQGGGSIVNISSGTALMYLENMAGYSSLKRALVGVSLTAREELNRDKISVSVVYPYITNTDFEKNTIKGEEGFDQEEEHDGDFKLPDADSSEYVAEKILEAIISGKAEVFAHGWMSR